MRFIRFPGLAVVFLVLLAIPAATASWAGTSFTVVAVDSGPPPLPYVQRIYTEPAHPTSRETTSVVLEGVFPYPCGQVIHRSNVPVSLELVPTVCLPGLPTYWREVFPIGLLATGHYQVAINLTVAPPAEHSGDFSGIFQFVVDDTDTTVTPGPLPYVSFIRIVPKPDMLPVERPICPRD